MSKQNKSKDKKGNKYQGFSKVIKQTDPSGTPNTIVSGKCPGCGTSTPSVSGKQNLCRNCYFGVNGHKKLGKPKKT